MAATDSILENVVYKDIPGVRGVRATSFGTIESCIVLGPGNYLDPARWRPLKAGVYGKNVSPRIQVEIDGKKCQKSLVKLVLLAFHGPCPEDHEEWIKDGDPFNARPDNLLWAPLACTRLWYRLSPGLNGCWEWTGARDRKGYGNIIFKGKPYKTSQLAYEFAVGPRNGLWVLHRCDNPPCCNPEHLFLGNHQDNVDDMIAKGRARKGPNRPETFCRGEDRKDSKLTDAIVREIRRRYAAGGVTMKQLGNDYGVYPYTIHAVIHRTRWSHVED